MTARRPEFDEICNGWSMDSMTDRLARNELLFEFWRKNRPLNDAELKVVRAMSKRFQELGGVEFPTFQ